MAPYNMIKHLSVVVQANVVHSTVFLGSEAEHFNLVCQHLEVHTGYSAHPTE